MNYYSNFIDENPKHVFKIETNFDMLKLQGATEKLLQSWNIDQSYNQFCFTHRDVKLSEDEKILDGCGSLTYKWSQVGEPLDFDESGNLHKIQNRKNEADFKIFNAKYKDSYFFSVYKTVKSSFKNIGRMRLMCLHPQTCYSWHYDKIDRLIVPIFSNEKCQFVIGGKSYFLPPEGNAFLCKTKSYHTAFNSDPKLLRVQLVFDILE